mmetsp:Transcript_47529/g.147149  ORF Transcript_47529/g.147149 Transcript_47529/m.147149 type:complete len:334 (+) Transcript_47529:673-1674(+)
MGGVRAGAQPAPREHRGPAAAGRVRLGPRGVPVRDAGVDLAPQEVPLPHPPLWAALHRGAAPRDPLLRAQRHGRALRHGVVLPLPRGGRGRQVQQGVLEEVVPAALGAPLLRGLPLGVRLAAGHLAPRPAPQRGLALHVHGLLLLALRLHGRVDVHHELHALAPLEQVPRQGPGAHLAPAPRHHGLHPGRQAPLERDALPRPAPRLPERRRHAEPARPLPRLAEGARRRGGGAAQRPLEAERRRGDGHAEDPAGPLGAHEVAHEEVKGEAPGSRPLRLGRGLFAVAGGEAWQQLSLHVPLAPLLSGRGATAAPVIHVLWFSCRQHDAHLMPTP